MMQILCCISVAASAIGLRACYIGRKCAAGLGWSLILFLFYFHHYFATEQEALSSARSDRLNAELVTIS
jgi:hypothetical protein